MKRMVWGLLALFTIGVAAPVHAEAFNWTGFYIGGHGGFGAGIGDPDNPSTPRLRGKGAFGGLQVGYDYQVWGPIVVGVMADVSFGNISGSKPDGNFLSWHGRTDMFGMAGARGGVSLFENRVLLYGLGGFAWSRNEAQMRCPAGARPGSLCFFTGAFTLKDRKFSTGYVVGGGGEVRLLRNVSLGVEYRYADYGKTEYSFNVPRVGTLTGKSSQELWAVMGKLNFRF